MTKKILILFTSIIVGYGIAQLDIFNSPDAATITESQAKDAALKLFAGTITSFSYDYDDRVPHYDIEITGTTEKVDIEVNATTGVGLITEREMLRNQSATTAINSQSTTQISSQQVNTNNTKSSTQQPSTSNAQTSNQQAQTTTTSSQRITESQAKAAALKVFSGTVTSIEYDYDDRVPHYDIEIRGTNEKVDVQVNASTGVATITERETIRNLTNTTTTKTQTTTQTNGQSANINSTASSSKNITQDQAISIAKQRASGTVTKVEYERDENKYEITIRNGRTEHDFEINALTGAIISYETDYDD